MIDEDDAAKIGERQTRQLHGKQEVHHLALLGKKRRAHVLLDHEARCLQPCFRQGHAVVPFRKRFKTAVLMPIMMRQHLLRRRSLAEIMHKRGKACGHIPRSPRRLVNDLHRMDEGIPFGMIRRRLRLAAHGKQFRKYELQ